MSDFNKLPATWLESKLGDVCTHPQYGFTTKAAANGKLKFLRTTDITSGEIDWESVPYCRDEPDSPSQYILEDGDVVISRAGSVGFSYLLKKPQRSVFASYLIRFRPLINAQYFAYFLLSPFYWRDIAASKVGIAVGNVNASKLREIPFPLAPLSEQQRIVAKIEELFSELDKGIENLKLARSQLTVYRQALLKHAFEGKLTADWRAANAEQLETGGQLLARIEAERKIRYQRLHSEWLTAVKVWEGGKQKTQKEQKPPKPREPKVLRPLDSTVREHLDALPASWAWGALGLMTSGVEYGTAAKSEQSGTHVVLRMGNLQNGKIDWSDLAFSSDADEIAQYQLHVGDVLFNRTNSPEWVGKTSMYRGERPALFAGYLIRVNHCGHVVLSEYLNWFLNSPIAKQHGNRVKTDGVNQSNINGDKLMNYPFPYCSLAEQAEVVRVIEGTISLIDHSMGEIENNLQKSEALRQSILKKSFTGELVPQDPSDEPAAMLLDRIRAERTPVATAAETKIRKPKAVRA